jgi:hypothetical protein
MQGYYELYYPRLNNVHIMKRPEDDLPEADEATEEELEELENGADDEDPTD